jgi:RNA polymerase sigma-70 factor, ECF subfamily
MRQQTDDHALLTRIAAADQEALRTLMTRHQALVFRFLVRRVRNEAIAEELANEVFAEAWSHARNFEGRASVSTWLLAIAHNRAVSSLRRRREENWDEDAANEIEDGGDNPEVATQKIEKGAILRRCIAALSPPHREIIDLVYYHEQSIADASNILKIPEATVKTRMFYARKQLSELLTANGIDRGWP